MAARTTIGVMAVALCAGLVAGELRAQGTPTTPRGARARIGPAQVTAMAALEPVGAAEGWGRVRVADQASPAGVRRSMTVGLFGLTPSTELTLFVDNVEVGVLTTDDQGDAHLRLESPSDVFPPVPDGLPPAGELTLALVVDASAAPTLEGEFVVRTHGQPGRIVYAERIGLEPVDTAEACGMARVTRDASDTQTFATAAGRLVPGESYQVVVDGFLAGAVTADSIGHARLRLSTADDDNPLPAEMQPIEDLRLVEWVDGSGTIVLSGSFTGSSQVGGGAGGSSGEPGGTGGSGGSGGTGDPGGQGGSGGDGRP
jgi:uncharacterized membrane protein YgcG